MKKHVILLIAAVVLLIGGFTLFSTPDDPAKKDSATKTSASADKAINIKVAIVNTATHPSAVALHQIFKKNLEERSGGRITVQVYDSGVLGEESSTIAQLQLGTLQMAVISDVLATVDPRVSVLNLPYLFENTEQVDLILNDPALSAEIMSGLPAHGLIGLSSFENGFRVMTNSVKPINTFEDMKGMKIRSAHLENLMKLLNLFGTNVAPLNFNELYGALQQGVVDGQENPWNTIVTQAFHEVQPYIAVTNHTWSGFTFVANLEWFNALPKQDQELIRTVALETSVAERKLSREAVAKNRKFLEEYGTKISTPDLAKFVASVQPMYDEFYQKYPEYKALVEKILAKKKELNK